MDRILQKFVPDPFVIAIFLTFLTFALAVIYRPEPEQSSMDAAFQAILFWGDGIWNLTDFTMHMAMILIGGFVVATSRPIQYLLGKLVTWVQTPVQAVLFCTGAAIAASWVNWGFGLVVGGFVALEAGRRLPHIPFRVLVASSYSGFLVWHAGLSGSVPLDMNTEGKVFTGNLGMDLVGVNQTLFGSFNLFALAAIACLLPMVNLFNLKLAEDDPASNIEAFTNVETNLEEQNNDENENWLNRTWLAVALLFALAGFYAYVLWVDESRHWQLNLNTINLALFMLGMLLHGTPRNFINAVTEAAPKIAPILIQYPLYSAIMSVLNQSGLAEQISSWFVDNSSASTFPLMTFYSAGILNLFVPSGGGQWAVQAPIIIPAAQALDVDISKVAMAVAWGDAWTNMAQPFWAIPLLSIAGLKIKDIIGFCLINLIASGIVLSLLFLMV